MCIDYTDLNKACPKDAYPLPNIDKLVDSASKFQVLSFMDAYFGYNQIRMHMMCHYFFLFLNHFCHHFNY